MDIPQIKSQLPITTVLSYYQIEIDKNKRAKCPFHNDKTPSLQVYPETGTWCCFSSNCSAGTGDQIQFIQLKEARGGQPFSKHDAIMKAKELLGVIDPSSTSGIDSPQKKKEPASKRTTKDIHLIIKLWSTFTTGLKQCRPALAYIEQRGIQPSPRMGYNGGRFHRTMKQAELVQCEELGLIKEYVKKGDKQLYQAWAKDCLIFPLKDEEQKVVSFYGRRIASDNKGKHYYLNNRIGLYPNHPAADTKRLILTESIIDAETLLQSESISSNYQVLALYGTNGLTTEHTEAVSRLKQLTEIILFLDGDQAGIKAAEKYSKELRQDITISRVDTPEGEDINSLIQGHSPEILTELIEQRTNLHEPKSHLSFSTEKETQSQNPAISESPQSQNPKGILDTTDPDQLHYTNQHLSASVWGGIEMKNLSRLRVSIYIQHKADPRRTYRDDLNLYSHASRERSIRQISERLEIDSEIIATTLDELTEGLERYRMDHRRRRTAEKKDDKYEMNQQEVRAAQTLLKDKDLVKKTSQLIAQSGLIGEGRNGLLLFFLYLSRLMDDPLHAIIYGKSGSGKTYLQSRISDCLPPEDVRSVTALTENTLYYSAPDYWKHKLLLIEDLDGIYEALLPLRELMSKQSISKLSTDKDSQGNNVQKLLTVEGPVCVSGATTKSNVYEDNANRSFMLHIDESAGHASQVMNHQRRQEAGLVDGSKQEEARQVLQNAQRLLRPIKVVNPYALKLEIPDCVFKKLRTNMHYLRLIAMITFYHQQQRKRHRTKSGTEYIKTELVDIEWANELVKESLIRKSDELSGELRSFFEALKSKTGEEGKFLSKELRKALRMHPMKLSRYLIRLESRGYIRRIGGDRYKGYEYRITDWEDYNELLDKVDILDRKLEELREQESGSNKQESTSEKAQDLPVTGVSHAFHTS